MHQQDIRNIKNTICAIGGGKEQMKVLLVSPLPPPTGGIARWSQIVINYFEKKDDIELTNIDISKKYKGKTTWLKRVLYGGFGIFKVSHEVQKALKNGSFDVMHMTTSGSLAVFRDIVLMKIAGRHAVHIVYHLHFGRIPQLAEKGTLEWRLLKRAFRLSDLVMPIDKKTEETIRKNCPETTVKLCPNPVDTDALISLIQPYDKRIKKIVYLGHIIKTKGVEELLDAWKTISEEYHEYRLELIGGAYDQEYADGLKVNGSAVLIGEKPHNEAMRDLASSSVFILPSYTEGFPNAVLEAMTLKVPIIATRVGDIPEMLKDGAGILIEPGSASAIEKALRLALDNADECAKMADRAFNRVLENYGIETVMKTYIETWENTAQL